MIGEIALGALFVLLLGASVLVVRSRNLVHSVFWLAAVLLITSALLVWLGAPFLAGIQVVLYTGGVITLMLFGVMLTYREPDTAVPNPVVQPGGAVVAAGALLCLLLVGIWSTPELEPEAVAARQPFEVVAVEPLGDAPAEEVLAVAAGIELQPLQPVSGEEPAPGGEAGPGPRSALERALARALVLELQARGLPPAEMGLVTPIAGHGREAVTGQGTLRVVGQGWFEQGPGLPVSHRAALARDGVTRVYVWRLDRVLGAVALSQEVPTAAIGAMFLQEHLLAFEVLSVLLLAAMIGAIVLARRSDP